MCNGSIIYSSTSATPAKSLTIPLPNRTSTLPSSTPTQRLRLAMSQTHHSETTLAAALALTRSTVNYSLNHPETLRASRLIALCSLTQSDPSWILYGDDPPPLLSLPGSTIGARIAAFRASLRMGTAAFSCSCGFPSKSYSTHLESDQSSPLISTLCRIADAYGINAASFLPIP